jgi:hypothetical protein
MKKKIIPNFLLIEGSKYKGELKDGKPHGQGTYTWPDGEKYVGKWKNNLKHGLGTVTPTNGKWYFGKWKDGDFVE